ncbi:MAG: asparagine synthase (glutamine-hydrolyzing) [Nitrospirae bacterium RIFOXYB2_FULL_43_5]|nr:MAG: asparagine synthase (glutamine-hydrolyzing) [Nitrospirae bacterium GWF2_44_13]OGW34002.1 MAG: asparagine synthase (glutamine-hydrolyzing) [Nitrospirae bacterium GWD2_44_7]OGW65043.1 MAG: asparagine synthase (glutamine-hydrolyzing) [Nitrospirae bacterium RIFOXYA2_FULL_44_9]OGW73540.1 MAG: asparagine synthase (glutamine-hydrolyzing) [Nitrospirae bacterium RIFOXYB2_FULL_43_5]
MCGIVGIIKTDNSLIDANALRRSTDMLARRGPDDSGIWVEEGAGLGHRRLSILDTTSAGHQPMLSENKRFVIVFNGEVYNFRELRKQLESEGRFWSSNSDTEVVLSAYSKWGVDCLKRFHGMFAFAIWDRRDKVLFAARDRMGVKPYYYSHSAGFFSFASRPRALYALGCDLSCEIDEQALRFYLELGYIPAPYFIYKSIRKLPPAHYLLLSDGELRIERYWDFRHITPDNAVKSEEELIEELDLLISRCVQSRMVSDVPLGAFLSGGIDSSLIVAMMNKFTSKPIKTFTIGFEEKRYDESTPAKAVADYLGTEHYCERLSVNDLLQLVPTFFEEYDEPFFDSSAFPAMAVSRLARQHVTVSLSGDGGDELFGGYHYYKIVNWLKPVFQLNEGTRRHIAALINLAPHHNFKLLAGALQKKDIIEAFSFSRSILKDFSSIFMTDIAQKTMSGYELFFLTAQSFPQGLHPSEQGMRLDASHILPEEYLQKVDVASMTFSLESREPLLDHDLVEWAMKLPVNYKLRNNQNKYLLRKLAYRYIPKKILDRPKQGFAVPIDDWLRGALKQWAEERLYDSALFGNISINQSKIIELWNLHQSRKRNLHPLLWAVLSLLEFFKRNPAAGRP